MNLNNDNIKYKNWGPKIEKRIISLHDEGNSIRKISRLVGVSKTSVFNFLTGRKSKPALKDLSNLSLSERIIIERLYKQGFNYTQIANKIFRSKNTIRNEIIKNHKIRKYSFHNRGAKLNYNAKYAHKTYKNRHSNNTIKNYESFIIYFKMNSEKHLSVEHIIIIFKKEYPDAICPCKQTVYNWLKKGLIHYKNSYRKPRKWRKNVKNNTRPDDAKGIEERPFEQTDYSQVGHYEIDLILSADRTKSILTLNHRFDMMYYAIPTPNKKAATINKCLRKLIH